MRSARLTWESPGLLPMFDQGQSLPVLVVWRPVYVWTCLHGACYDIVSAPEDRLGEYFLEYHRCADEELHLCFERALTKRQLCGYSGLVNRF